MTGRSSEPSWPPAGMSGYEADAWGDIQEYKAQRISAQAREIVPKKVKDRAVVLRERLGDSRVGKTAEGLWHEMQESGYLDKMVQGMGEAIGDAGSRLVPTDRVLRAYDKQDVQVVSLEQILDLDLQQVDHVMPRLGRRYASALAAEGGVAGFVAGGGSVFATGGALAGGVGAAPGASVVLAALATDISATITGAVTLAGHYGAYCGFDVDTDDPREQAFLLGVLGAASAGSVAAKDIAFTQTRQLAMMIVRRATWSDLSQKTLVKVVNQIFKRLAIRLTKQKLGQALPVLGAGIGAGLNYQLVNRVGRDARMLYRERFLIEKYPSRDEEDDLAVEEITIIPDDELEGPENA